MERQISFRQYRMIDLSILLVILAVCQYLISLATFRWFPEQLYVVSPVAAMVALVMMRWGAFAGIHAFAGGLLFAVLSGGSWNHILIYSLGNLAGLGAMLLLVIPGKERIRENVVLSLAFAGCVQALMLLGRAGVAALLGYSAEACMGFITTDFLSAVFTLFIIWAVRRTDGLFEDQKHYLLRVRNEEQTERREQF